MKGLEIYNHNRYLSHDINTVTVYIQIVSTYILAAN